MTFRRRAYNQFSSYNSSNHMSPLMRQRIVGGFCEWVDRLVEEGRKAYLLTFTYRRLPGGREAVIRQMLCEVDRVYRTLLTRIMRKPDSANRRHLIPIFIACPDLPVKKGKGLPINEIAINDGLHCH